MRACYMKNTLPMLKEPINVRIKFKKVGNLQYISHLDLQRTFHRILVRAGIPVWYTQGFNPHAKVVFSTPLSIGIQSECEFVDIRIDREISCELVKELLNNEVTKELEILEVYIPTTKFSDMYWADYEIEICSVNIDVLERLNKLKSREAFNVVKKTKSGEKNVDIIPLIKKFQAFVSEDSKKVNIYTTLRIDSENYLNPQFLLEILNAEYNILENNTDNADYKIIRNAVYFEDGITLFK